MIGLAFILIAISLGLAIRYVFMRVATYLDSIEFGYEHGPTNDQPCDHGLCNLKSKG